MDSSLRFQFQFESVTFSNLTRFWDDDSSESLNVGIQEYYLRNSLIQILFLLSLVDF